MKNVRIKPSVLRLKDASDYRKEFTYDGATYTIIGIQELSVPNEVAIYWVAHDTDVEIWDDNER